jgi:hypothetical protein
MFYSKICEDLDIRKADGSPDPGMAKLLENGYEPRKKETRARLYLFPLQVCPACHRKLKRAKPQIVGLTPRQRAKWRRADPEQRAQIIKKGLRR